MSRTLLLVTALLLAAWSSPRAAAQPPVGGPPRFTDSLQYEAGSAPLPRPVAPSTPSASATDTGAVPASFEQESASGTYQGAEQFFPEPIQRPVNLDATREQETTWYTRVDYFAWREHIDGALFVKEDGVLPTLGYQRRSGIQRFRAELFGSKVNYTADVGFDDGFVGTDHSFTDYLGLRGEYEFMYEPPKVPGISTFLGFGSRFWLRNLPDSQIDPDHVLIGYQESWWSFYPYVGMESRRRLKPEAEFYWRGRAGLMAFTYEHATGSDAVLFPRQGVTAQLEAGVRGPRWSLAVNCEFMQWSHSATVVKYDQDTTVMQPDSTLLLVGLKSGFSF
jgi:hypothetical protein